ncbi:MAG: hypothetical protein SF339_26765, partial [Blastocatellia bacterium]|nr:hypothetical protein [Blastocatellia bacterium]
KREVERSKSSSRLCFQFRNPASRAASRDEKKEREEEENSEITLLCVFASSREVLFLLNFTPLAFRRLAVGGTGPPEGGAPNEIH